MNHKSFRDKAHKGEAAIITPQKKQQGNNRNTKNKKIKNCLHPASV